MARAGIIACVILLLWTGEAVSKDYEKEWPALIKVAREYHLSFDDTLLLLAIRRVEAGKPGNEFGVKAAYNKNLEEQARWCAGSIKKNRLRYLQLIRDGSYYGSRRTIFRDPINLSQPPFVVYQGDFIGFMAHYGGPQGYGWAPIHYKDM